MTPAVEALSPDLGLHDGELVGRLRGGWVLHGHRVRFVHPSLDARFYQHGWHSWSPARWVRIDRPPHRVEPLDRRLQGWDPGLDGADGHVSHWVGAVELPGGETLLLGALGVDAHVGASGDHLWGRSEQALDWYAAIGPAQEVFENYAARLGEHLGSRTDDPGTLWCTWYSFGLELSGQRVRDVLGQLDGWPFDVFLVDDGWEVAVGDWEPNDRFPEGMAALADEVRATGRRPGLWVAPLIAHEDSDLARRHPDWLVTDAAGEPMVAGHNWGGRYHGLDTTHPAAREHLVALMRRVVLQWGWTYLKLDFLYAAAIPGWRHADIGREAAYRSGIELIRDAVGDDVHLNACGAPIVPSLGVFDSLRIGPDVHPVWEDDFNARYVQDYAAPGTRHAVSTSVARLWLSDVITVDPDVAYFRTRYNLLRPDQRRLLADLCQVTGFLATSDPPDWLDAEEATQMRDFLTQRPTAERLDWHRFQLDGRLVDFSAASLDHPVTDRRGTSEADV